MTLFKYWSWWSFLRLKFLFLEVRGNFFKITITIMLLSSRAHFLTTAHFFDQGSFFKISADIFMIRIGALFKSLGGDFWRLRCFLKISQAFHHWSLMMISGPLYGLCHELFDHNVRFLKRDQPIFINISATIFWYWQAFKGPSSRSWSIFHFSPTTHFFHDWPKLF